MGAAHFSQPRLGWAGRPAAGGVLPHDQSVAFLGRRLGDGYDHQELGVLAQALGDQPLGLEQAASYLEETATPIGEYVSLFDRRAQELFALGQPATSQETIATIWALSLQRIHASAPAAQDLLSLCAFLGPDDQPRDLLIQHSALLPEPLADAVRDRLAVQQALGALRRYSLITVTGDALSMHRLLQVVVRHQLKPDQQ